MELVNYFVGLNIFSRDWPPPPLENRQFAQVWKKENIKQVALQY